MFTCFQSTFLKIKIYCNLSHINIHYYLKLRIPIVHRHFLSENLHKNLNTFKHIAMIEEILFILHSVNGIYIKKYNYTYSNTNKSIKIHILVQI